MANIRFGIKYRKHPVPSSISNSIAIFSIVGGIVIGWIGTADFIPAHTSSIIQSILGLLLSIANGLKPFFGVKTVPKTVDIEDVAVIDDNAIEKKRESIKVNTDPNIKLNIK